MKSIRYINAKYPNTGAWKDRHSRAVERGIGNPNGHTRGCPGASSLGDSIVQAINAWCQYAIAHKARYESEIGDDGVLGQAWLKWGLAIRGLLNGETGDLHCGTLDSIIHDNLTEQGFEEGKHW